MIAIILTNSFDKSRTRILIDSDKNREWYFVQMDSFVKKFPYFSYMIDTRGIYAPENLDEIEKIRANHYKEQIGI